MVFSTIKRRPRQFGLSVPKHLDDDINTTSTFYVKSGANSPLQQPKVPLLRINSKGRHEAFPMSWQFCSIRVNIKGDYCYYWMINFQFKGNNTHQCLDLTSVFLSVLSCLLAGAPMFLYTLCDSRSLQQSSSAFQSVSVDFVASLGEQNLFWCCWHCQWVISFKWWRKPPNHWVTP